MKQTECRDKIAEVYKTLQHLSNKISEGLQDDGLDSVYLLSNIIAVIHMANRIKNKLKHKK